MSKIHSFLLIIIISLAIESISESYHYMNLVNAREAGNASAVAIHSQSNNGSTQLRNLPTEETDYSLHLQIITAIISASAAILGGYIASHSAHKKAMIIEKLRYDKVEEKESALEAKQKKEKDEYRKSDLSHIYRINGIIL